MADREVLQAGRRVIIDSRGNKTYAPFPEREERRPTSRTLGDGGAANAAQSIIDSRAKRDAEAGFKRGGAVTKKAPAKRPAVKAKGRK
jgi:hypothetical protein